METTSTNEVPFLSNTFRIPFFSARLHLLTVAAVCADWRVDVYKRQVMHNSKVFIMGTGFASGEGLSLIHI